MNHPILSFFLTMAAIASLSAADLKLGLDNPDCNQRRRTAIHACSAV